MSKLHRFIGDYNLQHGVMKLDDAELTHQLRDVLRLESGEEIILCDGKSGEAVAEIAEYGKDTVKVSVLQMSKNQSEPATHPVLYCAILKRENFELAAQKATEAGVWEIVPVISRRTVKLDLKADRVKKIIKEAAEQSGRGMVPELRPALSFEDAIKHAVDHNVENLFLHPGAEPFDAGGFVGKRVGIFIGPEGGWDAIEVQHAQEHGFVLTSIGKLTLRAETAATIAVYLAASQKGDA